MTADFLCRFCDWFTDTFTCESPDDAADAMADATRWGWLPALSGVAIGAGQAHAVHLEAVQARGEMSG